MNRRWPLTLLPAALAVAAGPATRPATAPTSRPRAEFVSGEHGFRLRYPADWAVTDRPTDGQLFAARTPTLPTTRPAVGRFATVGLRACAEPDAAGDAAVLKDVAGSLVNYVANHGGTHLSMTPETGLAYPARRVRFQTPGTTGSPTAVTTVVLVRRKTAYVFTFAAPADAADALAPDLDAVVRSFALDD